MREGRRHVHDVVRAEPEMVDVVVGGAHQHVVAMKRALGLAGRPRREQQLRDLVGFRARRGNRGVAGRGVAVEHDDVLERRQLAA